MKGQGKVKGILVEGNDGHEYLLGFGPGNSPIFSRRADGTFEPLEDVWRASKVAITQIGHTGGLIGPGMGRTRGSGVPFERLLKRSLQYRLGRPCPPEAGRRPVSRRFA